MTEQKPLKLWTRSELMAELERLSPKIFADPTIFRAYINLQEEINRRPVGVFSDQDVLAALERGQIVIEPFYPDRIMSRLGTVSYDVSLADEYLICEGSRHMTDFNPHDLSHVMRYYRGSSETGEACRAVTHREWAEEHRGGILWGNIPPEAEIIVLRPHEMILGRTVECIGARYEATTMMHAKSSVGRRNISACDDAGWGDIGYIGFWTLEIRNKNSVHVPLVVGQPLAQVIFLAAGPTERNYGNEGSYQAGTELAEVVSSWGPDKMRPRTRLAPFVPIDIENPGDSS